MTYGPMYAYVAYIGNTLFPDEDEVELHHLHEVRR